MIFLSLTQALEKGEACALRRQRRWLGWVLAVGLIWGMARVALHAAVPVLDVAVLSDGRVELRWLAAGETYILERGGVLTDLPNWEATTDVALLENGYFVARTQPTSVARFFRLRQVTGPLVSVTGTSPEVGEGNVAVTRESVFDLRAPLAVGTSLSLDRLHAEAAGRSLLARAELSADRRRATLYYLENLPSGTRVTVTFEGSGLQDEVGRAVDLDGDGEPGGAAVLIFDTANTARLAGTAITGRVLASERGAGGVDVPLVGVSISVDGQEETLRTTTAADGSFRLEACPAGRFFVNVDGRTATASQWPSGAYYPVIGKAWEAEAGRSNNLAGGTGIIYLPLVVAGTLQPVSEVAETRITFPTEIVAANPNLAGVEIRVPANGLFADNGTRGGLVGLAPVASDRLPEPLPAGLTHALDISIQTSGPQNFTAPVPARFPNLADPVTGQKLPPGAKTALWSFNHDTGRWELQGAMTVSPDGDFVDTDAGVGIRQPGWHGTAPGTSGSGGPSGDCTPGGILAEGTSSCRPTDDCPEDPSDALRQSRLCEARAGACSMKCYEDCGTSGKPESWLDFLSLAKDCREGAICSKACLDEGKRCKDKYLRCVTGGQRRSGADYRVARQVFDSDPLELEATRLIAHLEVRNAVWLNLVAILDLAPSFAQLTPVQRSQAQQLATKLFELFGGQWPATYAQAQLRRLHQAALQSPLADEFLPPASGYYVLEDLSSGLIRRGRTEPRGMLSGIILRAETPYRIRLLLGTELSFFDKTFISAATGQTTDIPYGRALAFSPVDADGDGDGIPAEAEFVLGTRDDRVDSDGDGVGDLVELRNHTNPLDGQPAVTGVVASLDTPGYAADLAVLGNITILADGLAGVAIVDTADPLRPRLLQQVDTPGDARAVAVEGEWLAVADGPVGLAVVNLVNPASPALTGSTPLGSAARAVAVANGVAYVGLANGALVAVDLLTGLERVRYSLPGNPVVEDVKIQDGLVFVWAAGRLVVLDSEDASLKPVASVDSGAPGGQFDRQMRLTLGPDRAYGAYPSGIVFFDLSNPRAPSVLAKTGTTQNGWKQLVPVLPNLALAPDGVALVDEPQHEVSLYRLGSAGTGLDFQARFVTPGVSRAIVIERGLAFVADGPAGLQVINFAPTDTAGIPPTVELAADFSLDPPQIESGQRARLTARVNDDVMVRQVEFFLDGQRVGTDGGWPFEFFFTAPERTATRTQFRLQVRATDVGGNVTVTPELTVEILPDQTPPRLLAVAPSPGSVLETVLQVVAFFNEPLEALSITANRVRVLSAGPDLVFGNGDDTAVSGTPGYSPESLAVTWTPIGTLTQGRYRFTVQGISDLAGNVQTELGQSIFYVVSGGPDGDADNDGLSNSQEGAAQTNPFVADTDGDGWPDEVELSDRKNPLDPASRPNSAWVAQPPVWLVVSDPDDRLPPQAGPALARPGIIVTVTDPADQFPTVVGPILAQPPVVVEVGDSDDRLPPQAGPTLARPGIIVTVTDPADQLPLVPGPILAPLPVWLEVTDPNDQFPASLTPVRARPPVTVIRP